MSRLFESWPVQVEFHGLARRPVDMWGRQRLRRDVNMVSAALYGHLGGRRGVHPAVMRGLRFVAEREVRHVHSYRAERKMVERFWGCNHLAPSRETSQIASTS